MGDIALAGERAFTLLLVVAARVVPVVAWLPAFGGRALPLSLRLGMGAALAAWFGFGFSTQVGFETLALGDVTGAAGFVQTLLIGVRELAIGVALAWLAGLVFVAVEMAGRLADSARRADGAGLLAPLSGDEGDGATPLSALFLLLAVLLFAELGGPAHVVAALLRSYEILPLARGVAVQPPEGLIALVAQTMAGSVEVAVGLAAPVLLAVGLADLAMALLGRLAGSDGGVGRVHSALAPLLGLGALLLGLGVVRATMEGWLLRIPSLLLRSAQLWGRG